MFKLDQSPSYPWPVQIDIVSETGAIETYEFTARFDRLTQSQAEEALKGLDSGEITDHAVASEILVGWDEVQGPDGEPLSYSQGNKQILLDVLGVRKAIMSAWLESLRKGREKN